jgi:metal-responsive CopG/Arc/MetJ family transcriptional regulator
VRTTIVLDADTQHRLRRFARSRKARNRSEAIRLAIREAERRLDIEEVLTRTGRFVLRYPNEELEAMEGPARGHRVCPR